MKPSNIELLAYYGHILEMSTNDMERVTHIISDSIDGLETDDIPTNISTATRGIDPKLLWMGAVMYSYLLDAYGDVE